MNPRNLIFLAVAMVIAIGGTWFFMNSMQLRTPPPSEHVYVMRAQRIIGEETQINFDRDIVIVAVPHAAVPDKTYILPIDGTVTSLNDLRTADVLAANERRVHNDPALRGQPPRLAFTGELFSRQMIERGAFLSSATTQPTRPEPRVTAPPVDPQPVVEAGPTYYVLMLDMEIREGDDLGQAMISPRPVENIYPKEVLLIHEQNLEAFSREFFAGRLARRDIMAFDVLRMDDFDFDDVDETRVGPVIAPDLTREMYVLGTAKVDIYHVRQIGQISRQVPVARDVPIEPRMRRGDFAGLTIVIEDEEDPEGARLLAQRLAMGVNEGFFAVYPSGQRDEPITNKICIGEVCYDREAFTPPRAAVPEPEAEPAPAPAPEAPPAQ